MAEGEGVLGKRQEFTGELSASESRLAVRRTMDEGKRENEDVEEGE